MNSHQFLGRVAAAVVNILNLFPKVVDEFTNSKGCPRYNGIRLKQCCNGDNLILINI